MSQAGTAGSTNGVPIRLPEVCAVVVERVGRGVVGVTPRARGDLVPPGVAIRHLEADHHAGDDHGHACLNGLAFAAARVGVIGPGVGDAARGFRVALSGGSAADDDRVGPDPVHGDPDGIAGLQVEACLAVVDGLVRAVGGERVAVIAAAAEVAAIGVGPGREAAQRQVDPAVVAAAPANLHRPARQRRRAAARVPGDVARGQAASHHPVVGAGRRVTVGLGRGVAAAVRGQDEVVETAGILGVEALHADLAVRSERGQRDRVPVAERSWRSLRDAHRGARRR